MGTAVSVTEPGSFVAGRYRIEVELARGGMGVVYQATDTSNGRLIALKRTLESSAEASAESELKRAMLQREFQTLTTLRHPRIIEVFDSGVDELGPFYTMELLDGVDLRSLCPMPWRDVCRHFRDVASSLALLHSRRLLHCDVSVGNVRLTSEGRAKLIDFGTLSSFGRNDTIAGTPPTVAPEALDGLVLDQRLDLYALGASAYYALTGRHAYPASSLEMLRPLWARARPVPPSAYVDSIPHDLDELVLSLLSLDRMSRPATAEEVIDRLGAIAGLPADEDERVARSYLATRLVGRDEERALVRTRLERAMAGRGGGVLLEGAEGLGKTASLTDLAREARSLGATVLSASARASTRPFGVFASLARQAIVLRICDARTIATHFAGLTGHLGMHADGSPLPDRLLTPVESDEQRAAIHAAFDRCLAELAAGAPVVVTIDDLHLADPDSLATYASLTRSSASRRILLAASIDGERFRGDPQALRVLRNRTPHVPLRPFDSATTDEFVATIFGDVPLASRLSSWLRDHASGNPGLHVSLIEHLVTQGHVRYAEGTWILPHELPSGDDGALAIGALVDAAFERRMERWGTSVRVLAETLSPHRGAIEREVCEAIAAQEPVIGDAPIRALLADLVRDGVLVEERGVYEFARPQVRNLLYKRLDDARRRRLHRRIAEELEARTGGDPRRELEVGFHRLLAGDHAKADEHIARTMQDAIMNPDTLVESVPVLWRLVDHHRKTGRDEDEIVGVEAILVVSGYYLDVTVQDRLGEKVVRRLHELSGLSLATRLRRWLTGYLALIVGLLVGWFRSFRIEVRFLGNWVVGTLLTFVGACSSMSGVGCFRLDRKVHPFLLEHLGVAKGLARHDALRLVYDLVEVASLIVRGRFAEAHLGLEDQLARLPKILGFTDDARHHYEAGLLFFIGRSGLQRLDAKTLEIADRIDSLGGRHDRVMAQFLRRTHYLYRGDVERAKREEERLDDMAVRYGSRWAPDLLSVLEFLPYHLAGDIVGLKRTLHRLDSLLAIAPGLALHREVLYAMYEGHRGRPERALEKYASIDAELAPFADPVWATARSHQAECLNALGRHEEALAICRDALAHVGEAARVVVFAYQQLEREAAIALAGLGRADEAAAILDALLVLSVADGNPLLVGLLHHDRARIACAASDRDAFLYHASAARAAFAESGNPALVARGSRLVELGRASSLLGPTDRIASNDDLVSSERPLYESDIGSRTSQALVDAVTASGASYGLLYSVFHGEAVLCARHGRCGEDAFLERVVASVLRGPASDDVSSIVASCRRASDEAESSIEIVPVFDPDSVERTLLGLVVLGERSRLAAVDAIDIAPLATELAGGDSTVIL